MGKYSRKFETKISQLFSKILSLYNSGSSALYIALESLNFPRVQKLFSVLTFSTTVGSIVKNNLVPVFIDVKNYCLDISLIEEKITPKTVAIMAPNLMGIFVTGIYLER